MADELKRLMQKAAQKAQPATKISLQGPGPFELPPCGMAGSIRPEGDHFVVELETVGTEQTIQIPLTRDALIELSNVTGALLAFQKDRAKKKN